MCRETPKRPTQRELLVTLRVLPAKLPVRNDAPGETQLGAGQEHEASPSIRLLGVPNPRHAPPESLLEEADGMLQVEPSDIGPPQEVEFRFAFAGEPLQDSPSSLSALC